MSFSADVLCQFSYFILCFSSSVFLQQSVPEVDGQGRTSRISCRRNQFFFVSVHACCPPTTSYRLFTFVLYFVGQPYRWLNIHPPEQGAGICFNYDCSDNQVLVKGTENSQRLYRVQIFIALDAACTVRQLSNAFQVALTVII